MRDPNAKVVLVTGASSGIGEATVRELLSRGHRVFAVARRVEKMEALRAAGAETRFLDLTDPDSIEKLVGEILATEGRIDGLVNNAGFGVYGAVEEVPIEEARRQFEVNLFGLARLTQSAIPSMRKTGSGTIVNVSSMGGKIYTPLGSWYHASKHALEGWSDCLRIELAPFGIRVVIVEPGAIETEFDKLVVEPLLERSGEGPYAEVARRMADTTRRTYASGRASSPELIAGVIGKAIEEKRPRTRYVAGYLARPVLLLRKLVSDRVFDRVIRTFG